MTKLEDVIETEFGPIEIWSQDEMEYFFDDANTYIEKCKFLDNERQMK